ncbi:hypothetical protein [Beijerinckia sp. L45]|uniref:hypothetical protein n=1 Tax=Beijerinckia sp. L45 TaxID=1641855 RepID=UPI00131D5AB4|nr:hypothetical protein [Beijerinckia sp. L45]
MRAGRASIFGVALCLSLPAEAAPALNLPGEIGARIAACWHPPAEGDEVTLRLSFRADGSLFGKPRMTYVKAVGGADGEAAVANSIFAALQACSPLRFTPALGAAIAGRTFLIRFVAPRKALRAAL